MARALKFNINVDAVLKTGSKLKEAIERGSIQGMKYAAQGTAKYMENAIQVRGTRWSSFRYSSGGNLPNVDRGIGPGRELTGKMLNSIGYIVKSNSISIGYVNGVEQYFRYQEFGFENWGTYIMPWTRKNGNTGGGFFLNDEKFAHWTPGIFAIRDGQKIFEQTSPGLIAAWVGINKKRMGI